MVQANLPYSSTPPDTTLSYTGSFTSPTRAMEEDALGIVQCHHSAFSVAGPYNLHNLLWARCSPSVALTFRTKTYEESFKYNPLARFVVIRDKDTSQIASCAIWLAPADSRNINGVNGTECEEDEAPANPEGRGLLSPQGFNVDLMVRVLDECQRRELSLPEPKEKCWSKAIFNCISSLWQRFTLLFLLLNSTNLYSPFDASDEARISRSWPRKRAD
jgi:hypothetical protein